ncbi:MAG: NAD-dependent epimerase/dehydratase family protein [SAR202 cluster bacterium]|nr:NAD-dependent epimerase/dehydratase family protein [SAR202 cluster bacterium]|tara:strand:- start:7873 stop:8853 length:981 start_codon:yes stop_codon:yes gene_type:complete
MATRVLVAGAGGFIGHHMVKYLSERGYWVRGVDVKTPEYEASPADEFEVMDLRRWDNCLMATRGIDWVVNLAADMGGIGYISYHFAHSASSNVLISTHMLEASRVNGVSKFFFSSSACVYPVSIQSDSNVLPLKEDDAHPADPDEGYGWEKLFTEKMCRYYAEDFGLETRVARFHNIFGPLGTYDGGREKAPAAICRKVALAEDNSEIEIWGDGEQTRSFLYVDDCVEGIHRLLQSDSRGPLNLGMDRLITINELVDIVCGIAGKSLKKVHNLSGPQGVRGRNSDNSRVQRELGWSPTISLEDGLTTTYRWIESKLNQSTPVIAAD